MAAQPPAAAGARQQGAPPLPKTQGGTNSKPKEPGINHD